MQDNRRHLVCDRDKVLIDLEPAIQRKLIASLLLVLPSVVFADPIPVRNSQGTTHAFLTVRDLMGLLLASGDLVQTAHGERVTSRLTFHFRDGSLDDETTIYTQRRSLQLVSDRHIQRGPSFPKPIDMLVEANGNVTMHDLGSDGKTTTEHLDLPPDTYNGLYFTILTNILPTTPETKIAMVVPTGKGRLVHLSIKPEGEEVYAVGASRQKANIFRCHIELGGIAGVVAPVIGKQPEDILIWVSSGDAPTILRGEAQLYEGGPVRRIELVSPAWPKETSVKR